MQGANCPQEPTTTSLNRRHWKMSELGPKIYKVWPTRWLGCDSTWDRSSPSWFLRLGWVLRISQPLKSAYKTSTRVICQKTVNERLRWKEKRQCSKKGMEPTGQTRFEKNLHNSDYTTRKKKRKIKGYWPKPYKKWYNLMVQPVEPTINYFNKFLKVF